MANEFKKIEEKWAKMKRWMIYFNIELESIKKSHEHSKYKSYNNWIL